MRLPTSEEATQFAIMLEAGLPASDAINYFSEGLDPAEVGAMTLKWPRCVAVRRAAAALRPKKWQEMTLEEKLKDAVDYHYTTLAYTLRSNHYGEVDTQTKSKLDSARQAIEAKLAGTAGKTDALSKFFEDLSAGRISSLGGPLKVPQPAKVN